MLYVAIPYGGGSLLGWGAHRNKRWAQWVVGPSRHPRAWDHLWSQNPKAIVRVKLRSGGYLAGVYEPSEVGIGSYAAGYGEEADLFVSRQLVVDSDTGAFEVDESGSPVEYSPSIGLLIHASDLESWHIQEVPDE